MAGGTALEEVAPAENYILDERVPAAREDDFLSFSGFASSPQDRDSWFRHHSAYAKARVDLPDPSATFTAINQPNWLALSPDWDVVRIETLHGLAGRANSRGSDVDDSEANELIREMLKTREEGAAFDSLKQARLEKWLQLVNRGSYRRPAFVAPFAEVEDILEEQDWANRLRDAFGLGHIGLRAGKPAIVVLMQYSLIRVHNTHIGKPAWAASPTVLDDVPGQMPSPCFFPAPRKADPDGYGFTVDLSATDPSFRKEFLHGHIDYTLDDIRRIAEVTTDVPPSRIVEARSVHHRLLKDDSVHHADLPARP